MNARNDEVLIEKLKALPPQRRAEVEDFVDFLKTREDEQLGCRAYTALRCTPDVCSICNRMVA